jgi:hypothetical protein
LCQKVSSIADAFNASVAGQRPTAVAQLLSTAGSQNVFAALFEYFLHLPQTLLDAETRKNLLAASTHAEMRRIFAAPAIKSVTDLLSYVFWFLAERMVPALERSDFDDPSLLLASVASCIVFWDAPNPRRMIMDSARALASCRIMLSSYMDIFPKVEMPRMAVLDETAAALELAKKQAKDKYQADEQERTRILAEREQHGLEKLKEQVRNEELSKAAKAELDQMVNQQRREFEQKQMEQQKGRMDSESAFEALKRQQAEAKARADAKMKLMKEKSLGSGVGGLGRNLSDASLLSVLGNLDVAAPGSKPTSPAQRAVGAAAVPRSNSSAAIVSTAPAASLSPGQVPMIKIPEIVLTAEQRRLIIVIPKLIK